MGAGYLLRLMPKFMIILPWAALLASTALGAEDPVATLQVQRQQIQTETVEIVGTGMNLDSSVSDTFWDIFNEYQAERTKIGDERVKLIRAFVAAVDTMTEEEAASMAEQSFKIENELLKLKEKYFRIMEKKISARVAARFVQVMNQIDSVVNSQLSREMPLIGGF